MNGYHLSLVDCLQRLTRSGLCHTLTRQLYNMKLGKHPGLPTLLLFRKLKIKAGSQFQPNWAPSGSTLWLTAALGCRTQIVSILLLQAHGSQRYYSLLKTCAFVYISVHALPLLVLSPGNCPDTVIFIDLSVNIQRAGRLYHVYFANDRPLQAVSCQCCLRLSFVGSEPKVHGYVVHGFVDAVSQSAWQRTGQSKNLAPYLKVPFFGAATSV